MYTGVYRAYGHGGSPPLRIKVEGGTLIEVPANAFTLYIYSINGNRSVKADFLCFVRKKRKTSKRIY